MFTLRRALRLLLPSLSIVLAPTGVAFAQALVVSPTQIADEKAVFGTVESVNVASARARIGGTLATLVVKEGDRVSRGQVIASVGDEKIALQIGALDAQIAGLEASLAQAQIDLNLAESLFAGGTIARIRLDEARTAVTVATNSLRARRAERSVLVQQIADGNVLAPASGRVLKVPMTSGAVVLQGEEVAIIAQQDYVLRLRVPERHARSLTVGDVIRMGGKDGEPSYGAIRLVYPQIEDGRVIADAVVAGVGDYFVGERVLVFLEVEERTGFLIPEEYTVTRYGLDYVRLQDQGRIVDVPVQRGRVTLVAGQPAQVEILSGIKAGDLLVKP